MATLLWLPRGHTVVEAVQIHVRALMHTLDSDLEASVCPGGGLHLHN
jgi:hypothetical protein